MMRGGRWAVADAGVFGPMRHSPGRTLLAVLAIALGVALGFAIYLINRVAADEVSLAARSLFGLADLAVEASGEGFDENLYPEVARLPGVAVASPVVEVEAKLVGRRGALTLLGMDPYRSRQLQPAFVQGATLSRDEPAPDQASNSAASEDPASAHLPAVALSASAARSLGLAVGDVLELQSGMERQRFAVMSVLPAAALRDRAGIVDIATVQWKFGRLGKLSRLNLRLAPGASPQAVRQEIARLLPGHVSIVEPGDAGDEALRLSRAYRSNLTALGLVALFTGGFFVYSTQSLAVLRRRREFALLHALGMTRNQQLALTLMSGALVGFVGALLGLVVGAALANAALSLLGGDLGAGMLPAVSPQLQVRFAEAAAFCLLGTGVAIAGSLRPSLDAARIPTASALKAGDVASAQVRTRGGVVVLLFALAAVMLMLPAVAGLPLPGYMSIALLIVATVAAMPAVLLGLLRLPTARSRAVPHEIALAHLRGTARYATLSVSAIVVSFSLMIAMAIMVASFRESLDAWTARLLPADLYLRSGSGRQSAYFDAKDIEALRGIDGVERMQVSRLAQAEVPLPDSKRYDTVTLVARELDESRIDRAIWMQTLAPGTPPENAVPVWINEAASDLFALHAGDAAQIVVDGDEVAVSVRGVWRDYEYPRGAVIMDRATYVRLTSDTAVNGIWMWLREGAAQASVQRAIRERLPDDAVYELRTPGEIRRLSLQAFDRTFAVTYALELIAILIGLFGISAGTSAQVLARRAEFGVLRHIGLTRGQIAATLAIEGMSLGGLGVVTGLLTGGAVSLILIYVVNRQSFHWSMDVHLPVGLMTGLSLALVGASALIAVLSGRQAMRGDVVKAVKEDW